ncbi:MAG: class I SAM-dependent methyltransferase [Actinomycetes bacterium]
MPQPLPAALAEVRALLLDPDGLVRAVAAGRRRGSEPPPWRRVELRPVDLKAGRRLQIVAYDERQATTSNEDYGARAAAAVDLLLAEPFGNWHVETSEQTVQLRVTKKGDAQVHHAAHPDATAGAGGTADERALHAHDRVKPRLLDPADPLLRELGISDGHGRVKPSRQAKYRQVEEMLRALAAVRDAVPAPAPDTAGRPLRVVDLGCGNAYLTFAAYRWLTGPDGVGRPVELVGVDVKAQSREHGEKVAAALGWSGAVRFVEGTVLDAPVDGADVVLALHACDTATDEALARAVRWLAPVILASPCCHHDIQRQLAAGAEAPDPYGVLVRHAILRERFADVLTDALRAAVLRLVGYRVDVVEFVGSEHTPRNTLIRAVRTGAPPTAAQVAEYTALTEQWHVQPHLATLLAAELAAG